MLIRLTEIEGEPIVEKKMLLNTNLIAGVQEYFGEPHIVASTITFEFAGGVTVLRVKETVEQIDVMINGSHKTPPKDAAMAYVQDTIERLDRPTKGKS